MPLTWAITLEKSLALVSAYSEIKYGEKYSASERFRKWFKTYAIDNFDNLANNCSILKEAKLNGQSVTMSLLKSISLNEDVIETYNGKTNSWNNNSFKLEHILYKIRCTDFHTQSRIMKDITINGKNPIFRLRLDEDNIYNNVKEENPIIYLCPQFFCWLILFSIDNFKKIIPTEEEAVKNRFNDFIAYNVDSVEITLKAKSVAYSTSSCNAGLHAVIATDKSIEINEEYFTAEHKNSCIEVNYSQISEIKIESGFIMMFNDMIGNYTGLSIDLAHPKLDELKNKLNSK